MPVFNPKKSFILSGSNMNLTEKVSFGNEMVDPLYYIDTTGTTYEESSDKVYHVKRRLQAFETVIYRREDFVNGDSNGTFFGNDGTDKRLYVELFQGNFDEDAEAHVVFKRIDLNDVAVGSEDYTAEQIQDIVGAMFTGNTETGIAATYEDSDGTLDFVVNDLHNVGVDGAANQMLTDDGDGTVTSQANLTFDSTTSILTATSNLGTVPQLVLKSNSAGTNGPKLFLTHNSASPAADDLIGQLIWEGEDADDNTQTYGEIQVQVVDPASGTEGGKMLIKVASHDGGGVNGIVIEDGGATSTTNVTIANGASSTTHVSGNLTLAGTADGRDLATDGAK